jgi:hypothetical protein
MIIYLTIWILLAYWCYAIAKGNGRNGPLSIVMGLLFGLFAVIVYAMLGKTPEQKELEIQRIIDKREKDKK